MTKQFDFSKKDPTEILTQDELDNFDEGMKPKNMSRSADEVDFGGAVKEVVKELDSLFA